MKTLKHNICTTTVDFYFTTSVNLAQLSSNSKSVVGEINARIQMSWNIEAT